MKLAEWTRVSGVYPQTANRWFRQGTMPVPVRRLSSGTSLVNAPDGLSGGRAVLYARVSAHNQRADLDRQLAWPTAWVPGHGVVVAGKRPPDRVSGTGA
jgi:putative resolvase